MFVLLLECKFIFACNSECSNSSIYLQVYLARLIQYLHLLCHIWFNVSSLHLDRLIGIWLVIYIFFSTNSAFVNFVRHNLIAFGLFD